MDGLRRGWGDTGDLWVGIGLDTGYSPQKWVSHNTKGTHHRGWLDTVYSPQRWIQGLARYSVLTIEVDIVVG